MKKIILLLLLAATAYGYEYAIEVKKKDGTTTQIPLREIQTMSIRLNGTSAPPGGIDKLQEALKTFTLLQNYPNPFNPSTTISFSLTQDSPIRVTIYDVNGRQVRELVERHYPAGNHQIRWDGMNDTGMSAAAGAYFYQVKCGEQTITRKMVLIK
ncbi:MAG TPA: T9SS type A sorting domain-containing protein [Syntrophomonas sp.]|nr:T9SS type A sorting domain-containing protein [Syntrophomonas sp.]